VSSSAATSDASWTIKVPNLVSATPNFAYPYMSGAYFSVSNINDFQQLMYRPLYWFGQPNSIAMNPALSLANAPVWSNGNMQVTINLKPGYKWSNGENVTAGDIMLWMNLMAAVPARYAGYNPPIDAADPINIPDLINSIQYTNGPGGLGIVFNLNHTVNTTWFLYNQLSQITPMPQAWDLMPTSAQPLKSNPTSADIAAWRGAAGNLVALSSVASNHGNYSTKTAGCWGGSWIGNGSTTPGGTGNSLWVAQGYPTMTRDGDAGRAANCYAEIAMMRSFGADTADYTTAGTDTARLFGIVDGPWKLKTFDPNAPTINMVPNPSFGGQAPYAGGLDFVPCTDEQSCYNLLLAGTLDQGGLPYKYAHSLKLGQPTSQAPKYQPAALKSQGYKMVLGNSWQFVYFTYNMGASSTSLNPNTGSIFLQKYFRVAFNELINQPTMIAAYEHGYSTPTVSAVPRYPVNAYSSHIAKQVYPFSVSKAKAALVSHGWKVKPNGVTTCVKPGSGANQCGAGVPAGAKASFQLLYASGSTTLANEMTFIQSTMKALGIQLSLKSDTFNNVIGAAFSGGSVKWDMTDWGGGWLYAPDYLPTGEAIFATGAGSNNEAYSDPILDGLIKTTIYGNGSMNLAPYDNYLAKNDPVAWMPLGVTLYEVKSGIKGFSVNPLQSFTPELWHH
jgi:ABC-type transport system substrate-binding protein